MRKLDFYPIPFDTETTGVDFKKSQVIQVGAIFCDKQMNKIHEQEWNINFASHKFDWSLDAQRVHGINYVDALTHGLDPDDFIVDFEETLKQIYGKNLHPKQARIVGAQAYFDYIMCQNSLWDQFNKEMPISHRLIDINCIGTVAFDRDSLSSNMEFFDIQSDESKRHTALYDAQKHYEVFCKQMLHFNNIK